MVGPLPGVQASPSCLVDPEAQQLLLYFPACHQSLSRGPKIAVPRKARRGKTTWRAGLGLPPARSRGRLRGCLPSRAGEGPPHSCHLSPGRGRGVQGGRTCSLGPRIKGPRMASRLNGNVRLWGPHSSPASACMPFPTCTARAALEPGAPSALPSVSPALTRDSCSLDRASPPSRQGQAEGQRNSGWGGQLGDTSVHQLCKDMGPESHQASRPQRS